MKQTEYAACALGEILIDFTPQGINKQGQRLFAQNAGGAPGNVAAAMAKLGAKTAFIGKAGNDIHGRFLKETLESSGINTDGLILSDKYFTTLAFVNIKDDGEREFSFARQFGADRFLDKSEIPTDIIKKSAILHIGSISATDEPSRSATLYALKKAKEYGTVISYDPNYRPSLWKNEKTAAEQMSALLGYADIVKLSNEETEILTGTRDYRAAAEIIIDRGVKIVAVTLGKNGAYIRTQDGERLIAGYKSKAVDATGAGDTFWGSFLYQVFKSGKAPEDITADEAANFADYSNAAASICVEGYGAIAAMPSAKEIEDRMKTGDKNDL